MKYILSGTNRPGARTLEVSRIIQKLYKDAGENVELIDLGEVSMRELDGSQYADKQPDHIQDWVTKLNASTGVIIVCPEYNGSMPGILKYFIDHWKYPETFEYRPFSFVGLGGRFGGMRPVEHLQQIVGYRNGYIYPIRVFIPNIWSNLANGEFKDPMILDLLKQQVQGFQKFVKALESQRLDANNWLADKKK